MTMIAVPLQRGGFCSHFGGADAFALYTVDDENRMPTGRKISIPPEHGRGVFPMWLRDQGVTTVIAGGGSSPSLTTSK